MFESRLVEIVNDSSYNVFLRNLERQERNDHDLILGPQSRAICRDLTIPSADSAEQFELHHLELEVGPRSFSIWQQPAGLAWSSQGAWVTAADADILPGGEAGAGAYRLLILEDGQLRVERVATEALAESRPVEVFDAGEVVEPADVPAGRYIDYIYGRLRRDRPEFEGITYGKSESNRLGASWLLQTPNYWGKSARDLPPDHSHSLGTEIRELIASAEYCVDITTLHPAPMDGWFLECIGKGIGRLVSKNKPIAVRILIGNYPLNYADTEALLKGIEKWAPGIKGSKLHIYAAGLMVTVGSWNHSKIVAVDSQRAITGGHNLWWADYLCSAPVHDVSMQLEGPAARLAQAYCNRLWAHVVYWNRRAAGIYANDYEGRTGRIGGSGLGQVGLSYRPGPGTTEVLALGRTDIMDWNKGNQSDYALRDALGLAKRSIKLSQQDLLLVAAPDLLLMEVLAKAILRDVELQIVLSTPGATAGSGTSYAWAPSLEASAGVLIATTLVVARAQGISPERATVLILKNLKLAPIHFSADREWPADRAHDLCGQPRVARKIANHAKVWIVDDQLFYIGSQNSYPSFNQEFGWMVEGVTETNQLLQSYWNPLWSYSSRHMLRIKSEALSLPALKLEP